MEIRINRPYLEHLLRNNINWIHYVELNKSCDSKHQNLKNLRTENSTGHIQDRIMISVELQKQRFRE